MAEKPTPDMVVKFTQDLVDKGKLIEAGWVGLKLVAVPPEASQIQIDELRNAFFAGAQHLWGCVMSGVLVNPRDEPTDKELERMSKINDELVEFITEYKKRHGP